MTKAKIMLEVRLKKGTPYSKRRRIVYNLLKSHFKISVDELTFNPSCCNYIEKININKLPLEDIVCNCGKTILIKYTYY
jgi:hypothetical protein